MKSKSETYQPNKVFFFLRSLIALLLIAFVLAKPIRAIVIEFTQDKTELAMDNSEQEESEQQDSEEEDSEEDVEKEDKIQETYSASLDGLSSVSRIKSKIIFIQDHSCDFKPGIVVPPPEQT